MPYARSNPSSRACALPTRVASLKSFFTVSPVQQKAESPSRPFPAGFQDGVMSPQWGTCRRLIRPTASDCTGRRESFTKGFFEAPRRASWYCPTVTDQRLILRLPSAPEKRASPLQRKAVRP